MAIFYRTRMNNIPKVAGIREDRAVCDKNSLF